MWGFLLAIIAGLAAKQLEEPVARPVAAAISPVVRVEAGELRLLSFAILMLAVGIISELIDSGSTFWVILGGVLGLFGVRLYAFVIARIDGRDR